MPKENTRIERGVEKSLGPFRFKTPDWDCRVAGCEEKADGIVDMGERRLSVCVNCAPQYLEFDGAEWEPLAGARKLERGDADA